VKKKKKNCFKGKVSFPSLVGRIDERPWNGAKCCPRSGGVGKGEWENGNPEEIKEGVRRIEQETTAALREVNLGGKR